MVTKGKVMMRRYCSSPSTPNDSDARATEALSPSHSAERNASPESRSECENLFGRVEQSSPCISRPLPLKTLMSAMPTSPSPLCTMEGNSRVLSQSPLRDGNIDSSGMKANLLLLMKNFACASFCVFVFMLLFFCFFPLPRDLLVDGLVVST